MWKKKALIILTALVAMLFPVYCLKAQPAQPAEQRVLYLSLPYDPPGNTDRRAEMVDALRYLSPWFTHVWVVVPSWYEFPDAMGHYLVKHAVNIIEDRGMKLYWGRFLWEAWKGSDGKFTSGVDAHFKASHYAAALATIRVEARYLGAVGYGFDGEVYGDNPPQGVLRVGLTGTQQARMRWAIREAKEIVGSPDQTVLAYPQGYPGNHTTSYCWPVGGLGNLGIPSSTYYSTSVEAFQASPRFPMVPDCYDFKPGLWGLHVGDEGEMAYGDVPLITPGQARAVDIAGLQAVYPSVQGLMIYISLDDRARIMRKWEGN